LFRQNDVYNDAVHEVQSLLSNLNDGCDVSADDIEQWNNDIIIDDDDDDVVGLSDDDEPDSVQKDGKPKVAYSAALESCNTLIKWYEAHDEANQVADLLNMRSKMVKDYHLKERKQKHIDEYFKQSDEN